jgi:endonuclease/exonuclease/phosphatase family metal-dependent hydrolase
VSRAARRVVRAALAAGLLLLAACAAPPAGEPQRLRLLSYNIHHGEGTDGIYDLERIARLVAELDPDLVALQEVDQGTRRASGVFQADELARLTGMDGRFGRAIDYSGGEYGEAVLSRLPLRAVEALALPASPGHEERCALLVELDGPAGPFRFVATHLDHTPDDADRVAQVEAVLARLADRPDLPTVLIGDLNAVPGSAPLALLGPEWLDAPLAAGAADPTYPSAGPERRIDHVLLRPAARWRVLEARVVPEEVASDHRPLLVVVELLPDAS